MTDQKIQHLVFQLLMSDCVSYVPLLQFFSAVCEIYGGQELPLLFERMLIERQYCLILIEFS